MEPIRVLVVDDAIVVRRMVTDVFAEEPDIVVVGTAPNGAIAVAKVPQVNPDVVILDVEMPGMNGLEVLAALRRDRPDIAVIMYSSTTLKGAAVTLEALARGALDCVAKPQASGMLEALAVARADLIPRVRALGRKRGPSLPRPVVESATRRSVRAASAVAIAVSTGGPNALAALLPQLPADFPAPIFIAQHMPPVFTQQLAERLDNVAHLRVCEAVSGAVVEPGTVWLAPGDYHMVVERAGPGVAVRTHRGPLENSCRPAADVLFRSMVEVYQDRVLGVILTGMGQDGARGCEAIRAAGGQVIVQDEASSVVWGMPGYVANAGWADRVLPLDQLAGEIVRRTTPGFKAVA